LFGSLYIDFLSVTGASFADTLTFRADTDFVAGRENPVPEPGTMLLFGLGLLGIGAVGRKKS